MPIINTVIQGGGTTPTGTKNITANGVYDVTDFASADVQVPTTAPALYREFQLDNTGTLIPNKTTTHIMSFTGVTDVSNYALYKAYDGNTAISGVVDMSDLTTVSGNNACIYMFQNCTGLTSVNLSALTTVSGNNACMRMFQNCSGLTSINLNSLTSITNSSGCSNMFYQCIGLTSVALPSLTTISGARGCDSMFSGCGNLISADLSVLVNVTSQAQYGICYMFDSCTKLVDVNLSSLETINGQTACANYMFRSCTSLTKIDFPSLKEIKGSGCLQYMFNGCTSLTTVNFYALNTSSFGTYTNQFGNMLQGCTGVTVHFPMAIQSTIGSWSSVTGGFGGTNTTVLFDIVTSLTGADSNTYTRKQKESTGTATAWTNNDTLYYTSGTTEPQIGDTIYSDSACTTAVTTISAIA